MQLTSRFPQAFIERRILGATGRTRPVPFDEGQDALVGYDQWHPNGRKPGKLFTSRS